MTLEKLDALSSRDAVTFFRQCCGSAAWAMRMEALRPFHDAVRLHAAAGDVWNGLSEAEWKEAFSHHPKIGDLASVRTKRTSTAALAEGEQSGIQRASERMLQSLADGNRLYEAKFGYIFIVCATGKSAEAMLTILLRRLDSLPGDELAIAAAEQAKITALRIDKLVGGSRPAAEHFTKGPQ